MISGGLGGEPSCRLSRCPGTCGICQASLPINVVLEIDPETAPTRDFWQQLVFQLVYIYVSLIEVWYPNFIDYKFIRIENYVFVHAYLRAI